MNFVPDSDRLAVHFRISQFLYYEARLLDERRWSEWDGLFTEDGVYWAPASPEQPDPDNHVSLIYDTDLLRRVRLARYDHPNAFSLQPFPRSAHLVTNVMIDEYDESTGEIRTNSRFLMCEFRRGVQRFYAGEYVHDLVETNGALKIRSKKATLVNCEGPLESTSLYF